MVQTPIIFGRVSDFLLCLEALLPSYLRYHLLYFQIPNKAKVTPSVFLMCFCFVKRIVIECFVGDTVDIAIATPEKRHGSMRNDSRSRALIWSRRYIITHEAHRHTQLARTLVTSRIIISQDTCN
jgi:hypothetical protein